MLGEAKEELAKVTACENQISDLRTRFEDDYALIRSQKYEIPEAEGKWDSFTTNRPSTDTRKLINTLASSHLRLWISLSDEDEQKRQNLSKTEQFPYGAISLRDSIYQTIPEALPLHESLSWFAPVRGWLAVLCYLFEEDDGKNGKVKPHIPVWDILNTTWISGSNGLLWACYKRFASKEEVKEQYGEDLKPDEQGRVTLNNVWDTEQYGTIGEGEWLKKKGDNQEKVEHGLGHIPLLILPSGSTPLIQSGEYTNTIKDVGESSLVNNRHLYDTESRMGSYLLTLAGRAAKTPMAHEWDSTRGGVKPELESSPFEKGAEIPIDIGKGEKLVPLTTPEMTRDAYAFFDYLQGREAVGGMTPVSFGQINQALPASGINLLRHASMDNIKPFQKVIERAYVWLAHELVSQYKSGGFEKMEIQGIDGSNRRFKVEVKPEDIDDSWMFEAELKASLPQDEMSNMGMAIQGVESELLSRETARDKYGLVDDTDLEQRKLDREKAYNVAAITMRRVAGALRADGDEEGARFIFDAIEDMKTERKPGVASQPGTSRAVRPSADTSAVLPQPPQASKLRNFLSRMGGG